jgi:YD repeat-containing protein
MNGMKYFGFAGVMLIAMVIESLVAVAAVQDLVYDSANPVTNISYDSLNRILAKNYTSGSLNYSYDADYFGTLTNVKFANGSVAYEYDDKLRVVREVRFIDGIRFEKSVDYDSADRIVRQMLNPGNETHVIFDSQGLADRVVGFINVTKHNAFGNALNRTYYNGKVSNFTYDSLNGRLTRINTNAEQNLVYSYDAVGNVMAINDSANNRSLRMGYDYLDRLFNMSLNGGQSFVYSYDAIGSLLKIVKDGATDTRLVYDGNPVHAPARIITGNANAQVRNFALLNNSNISKVYEFRLVNEKNITANIVNWTINFGDLNSISSSNFNLSVGENVYVFVEHNYSRGGSYIANISVGNMGSLSDFDKARIKFGVYPESINILSRNVTNVSYTLVIRNDLVNDAANVTWQCNNGLSGGPITVGSGSAIISSTYNYSSSGITTLNCSVYSLNGNDSIKVVFDIKGIKIDNYNRSVTGNTSTIAFNVTNYFYLRNISWHIFSDGQAFTGTTTSIPTNSSVIIAQSINYTGPGKKTVNITIWSDRNLSDSFSDSFTLKSIDFEDYHLYNTSLTKRVFDFMVKNYWTSNLSSSWNITDPTIASSSFSLGAGETLWVFVESDNVTQGTKRPVVNAYNGSLINSVSERFLNKLLGILNYEVIIEARNSTFTEAFIKSNKDAYNISWALYTGEKKITNTQNLSVNALESVALIIETNYSVSDVFNASLYVNSTSFNDSAKGAIIT